MAFCTNCGGSLGNSQNFCGSCGSKVGAPVAQTSSSSNSVDGFSHYAHAFNSIFLTKFESVGDIQSFFQGQKGEELLDKANSGNPYATLMVAMIYCTEENNYGKAYQVAELAMTRAKESKQDLGQYWFGYGFALEQVERFEDALEAHENALELGFGEAAFNLGRVLLTQNADLPNAIKSWKVGRDKFGSRTCAEMLEDLETESGVYSASIQMPDGRTEILYYSDRPGGLGTFK